MAGEHRSKGTLWTAYEVDIEGKTPSHLPIGFATESDAQAFLDNNSRYSSGDTFRLVNRDGPSNDKTICAA